MQSAQIEKAAIATETKTTQSTNTTTIMPSAPTFTGRERLMLPEDYTPGDDVVIIGRGKKVFQHPGNIQFREIVDSYLDAYKGAATKGLKSSILWNILTQVRSNSQNNFGFVKKDPESGRWCAVDDANARINIAQAFRDRLSNSYKSSKQHKSIKRKHDLGLVSACAAVTVMQQDFLMDENILASLVNVDAKKFYQDSSSCNTSVVQPNKRICPNNRRLSNSKPSTMPKLDSSFGRIQSKRSSLSMGQLRDILDTASKVTSSSDCCEPLPKVTSSTSMTSCTSLSGLLKQFEATVDSSCQQQLQEENPFEPIALNNNHTVVQETVMTPMMAMLQNQQQDMFEASFTMQAEQMMKSIHTGNLDSFNESDLFLQLDDCLEFVANNTGSSNNWNAQPEPLFSS